MAHRRWAAAVVVAVAGACGSGGAGDDEPAATGDGDIEGVDLDDGDDGATGGLRAELEDLLARHDELTDRIMADPTVVHDAGSRLVDDYLALFAPGSEQTADALARWAERADSGTSVESTDPDAPAITTRLDEDEIPAPTGDEVTFRICNVERYVVYGPDGRVAEMVDHPGTPGTATAVRVDGAWRLRAIDVVFNGSACRHESEAP